MDIKLVSGLLFRYKKTMLDHLKEKSTLVGIKKELSSYLKTQFPLQEEDILLEQPRHSAHGHLAWPLFPIAKKEKKAPPQLAGEFSQKIQNSLPSFLKSCEALSGFVNFSFQESYIQKHLIQFMKAEDLLQASSYPQQKEHWVLDFASPNVAKDMNIGHLRATVLGQALVNLARAFGFKITAINHLGDWGSQFGKLLWAYKEWGKEYDFKTQAFESLVKLYVRFHEEEKLDPHKTELAREMFKKLEEGDKELKKLWQYFVTLSTDNYSYYWKLFDVHHDLLLGESFYVSFVEDLKKRLRKKELLKPSEGAEVVFLENSEVPCLISKSDGASTYSSRDLCSMIYRFEKLKADRNIYITGSDQALHFKQIFEVMEKLEPDWKNLHLSFGMYRFKGSGKMSTRKGKAVYIQDIVEQAIERVKKIIQERKLSQEENLSQERNLSQEGNLSQEENSSQEGNLSQEENSSQEGNLSQEENSSQEGNLSQEENSSQEGNLSQEENSSQEGNLSQEENSSQEGNLSQEENSSQEGNLSQEENSSQEGNLSQEENSSQEGNLSQEENSSQEGNLSQEEKLSQEGNLSQEGPLKQSIETGHHKSKGTKEENNFDKSKIPEQVGIGALIFNDLMQDRIKDVDFDWNKVLDFEGSSGPFVQYSLVRARSLLKKAGFVIPQEVATSKNPSQNTESHKEKAYSQKEITFESSFEDEEEKQLAWLLLQFESLCFQSLQKLKPHLLARYLLNLSKEFNRFYNAKKIIGHPREKDRLLLTNCTYRVLSKGLELLNIARPKVM